MTRVETLMWPILALSNMNSRPTQGDQDKELYHAPDDCKELI